VRTVQLPLNAYATLVAATLVLLLGRWLIARIAFLRTYSIPEPVVGGLLVALVVTGLRSADVQVAFDASLQSPLMLMFFASVGLGADARSLARGGAKLLVLLAIVVVMLIMQNAIGIGAAIAMDLNPLVGLLSGSIAMAGGHGTGAAWAARFAEEQNLAGALELAIASATFGLILGGLVGGPVARRLIERLPAERRRTAPAEDGPRPDADRGCAVDTRGVIDTLLLMAVCLATGSYLAQLLEGSAITLPAFVWTLFVGIILRNLLGLTHVYAVRDEAVSLIGGVALSIFLAMALMSLRLWQLVDLAVPIFVILVLQASAVAVFATFVTFRAMGRDYDAAVIAAGQCGFGLGATPTAIANMQAVTGRYGPSPQAFLLVPIVGAFLIDITNALVIQGFLSLPVFGF
jgi:ESS family glutamate:Na+ symporter